MWSNKQFMATMKVLEGQVDLHREEAQAALTNSCPGQCTDIFHDDRHTKVTCNCWRREAGIPHSSIDQDRDCRTS